jgi:hypothetical protein
MKKESYELPLLITRGMVLFPNQSQSIEAGRPFSVAAIEAAKVEAVKILEQRGVLNAARTGCRLAGAERADEGGGGAWPSHKGNPTPVGNPTPPPAEVSAVLNAPWWAPP